MTEQMIMTVGAGDEARIYATGFELRDIDATESLSMIAGRAVPYSEPTDLGLFTEEIAPGTFARSIRSDAATLPLHIFHGDAPAGNPTTPWPVGVIHEWNDDQEFLRGVWRVSSEPEAQRAARMARDGMLNYMSVRFHPFANKTDIGYGPDSRPHLVRRQARLLSTSLVTTPAYDTAGVEWVRSSVQLPKPGAPGTSLAYWTDYLERVKKGPVSS